MIALKSGRSLPDLDPLSLALDYNVWSDFQGWMGYAKRHCTDPGEWVVADRERLPKHLRNLLTPGALIRIGIKWDAIVVVRKDLDKPLQASVEPRRIDALIQTQALIPFRLDGVFGV